MAAGAGIHVGAIGLFEDAGGCVPDQKTVAVSGIFYAVEVPIGRACDESASLVTEKNFEACVIGRYGPIESLRISWHITTNYRGKFLLIVVIAIGSALSLYLPTIFPEVGTGLTLMQPALRVVSSSVSELLSIVWASAYAHIYVQGVVS